MTEKQKQKRSRLEPQIESWYEDLPLRDAPLDPNDQPNLHISTLRIDGQILELSRDLSNFREFALGVGILGCPIRIVRTPFAIISSRFFTKLNAV
jgi:hypothetical protein